MISINRQKGFTLMTALFLLVILSLIASFIVSIAALTRDSDILTAQGTRAYYAAKSGLEWGIYQVTQGTGSPPSYNCPAPQTTITFTQGAMTGFSAVVKCTPNQYTEGGITYSVFQIISIGQYGTAGTLDNVSRQLNITVIQPGM